MSTASGRNVDTSISRLREIADRNRRRGTLDKIGERVGSTFDRMSEGIQERLEEAASE